MGSLWLGQMADYCSGFVLFCVGSVTNNAEGPPPTGAGQGDGDYMQLGTILNTLGRNCSDLLGTSKHQVLKPAAAAGAAGCGAIQRADGTKVWGGGGNEARARGGGDSM